MSGERLDLDAVAVDPVCAVRVPAAVALRRLVLPLSVVDGALHVGQSTYGDINLHLGITMSLRNAAYPHPRECAGYAPRL